MFLDLTAIYSKFLTLVYGFSVIEFIIVESVSDRLHLYKLAITIGIVRLPIYKPTAMEGGTPLAILIAISDKIHCSWYYYIMFTKGMSGGKCFSSNSAYLIYYLK